MASFPPWISPSAPSSSLISFSFPDDSDPPQKPIEPEQASAQRRAVTEPLRNAPELQQIREAIANQPNYECRELTEQPVAAAEPLLLDSDAEAAVVALEPVQLTASASAAAAVPAAGSSSFRCSNSARFSSAASALPLSICLLAVSSPAASQLIASLSHQLQLPVVSISSVLSFFRVSPLEFSGFPSDSLIDLFENYFVSNTEIHRRGGYLLVELPFSSEGVDKLLARPSMRSNGIWPPKFNFNLVPTNSADVSHSIAEFVHSNHENSEENNNELLEKLSYSFDWKSRFANYNQVLSKLSSEFSLTDLLGDPQNPAIRNAILRKIGNSALIVQPELLKDFRITEFEESEVARIEEISAIKPDEDNAGDSTSNATAGDSEPIQLVERWSEFDRFDCVALTGGFLVIGSEEFSVSFGGCVYLFSTTVNRDSFIAEPIKFIRSQPEIPANYIIFILGAPLIGKSHIAKLLDSDYAAAAAAGFQLVAWEELSSADESISGRLNRGRFIVEARADLSADSFESAIQRLSAIGRKPDRVVTLLIDEVESFPARLKLFGLSASSVPAALNSSARESLRLARLTAGEPLDDAAEADFLEDLLDRVFEFQDSQLPLLSAVAKSHELEMGNFEVGETTEELLEKIKLFVDPFFSKRRSMMANPISSPRSNAEFAVSIGDSRFCPVCLVSSSLYIPAVSSHSIAFGSFDYQFCSESCQTRFQSSPIRFSSALSNPAFRFPVPRILLVGSHCSGKSEILAALKSRFPSANSFKLGAELNEKLRVALENLRNSGVENNFAGEKESSALNKFFAATAFDEVLIQELVEMDIISSELLVEAIAEVFRFHIGSGGFICEFDCQAAAAYGAMQTLLADYESRLLMPALIVSLSADPHLSAGRFISRGSNSSPPTLVEAEKEKEKENPEKELATNSNSTRRSKGGKSRARRRLKRRESTAAPSIIDDNYSDFGDDQSQFEVKSNSNEENLSIQSPRDGDQSSRISDSQSVINMNQQQNLLAEARKIQEENFNRAMEIVKLAQESRENFIANVRAIGFLVESLDSNFPLKTIKSVANKLTERLETAQNRLFHTASIISVSAAYDLFSRGCRSVREFGAFCPVCLEERRCHMVQNRFREEKQKNEENEEEENSEFAVLWFDSLFFACSWSHANLIHRQPTKFVTGIGLQSQPTIVRLSIIGSGSKLTPIAESICQRWNLIHIRLEEFIQKFIDENAEARDPMARQLVELASSGSAIPDSLIVSVLSREIRLFDRGYLIENFPLTREQMNLLIRAGLLPDQLFWIKSNEENYSELQAENQKNSIARAIADSSAAMSLSGSELFSSLMQAIPPRTTQFPSAAVDSLYSWYCSQYLSGFSFPADYSVWRSSFEICQLIENLIRSKFEQRKVGPPKPQNLSQQRIAMASAIKFAGQSGFLCPICLLESGRYSVHSFATFSSIWLWKGKIYFLCDKSHVGEEIEKIIKLEENKESTLADSFIRRPIKLFACDQSLVPVSALEYSGFCPVSINSYRLGRLSSPISNENGPLVLFGAKFYRFSSSDAVDSFFSSPSSFIDFPAVQKFPVSAAQPRSRGQKFEFPGDLERNFRVLLSNSLKNLSSDRRRIKFPGLGIQSSALIKLALELKSQNPAANRWQRQKFKEASEKFNYACDIGRKSTAEVEEENNENNNKFDQLLADPVTFIQSLVK